MKSAYENRRTTQTFVSHIAWESEVWIAEAPDHMIDFNGERFLGPYPDVIGEKSCKKRERPEPPCKAFLPRCNPRFRRNRHATGSKRRAMVF